MKTRLLLSTAYFALASTVFGEAPTLVSNEYLSQVSKSNFETVSLKPVEEKSVVQKDEKPSISANAGYGWSSLSWMGSKLQGAVNQASSVASTVGSYAVSGASVAANKMAEAGKAVGSALSVAGNYAVQGTVVVGDVVLDAGKTAGSALTTAGTYALEGAIVAGKATAEAMAYVPSVVVNTYNGYDLYETSKVGIKHGREWWNAESDFHPLENPIVGHAVEGCLTALKLNAYRIEEAAVLLAEKGFEEAARTLVEVLAPINMLSSRAVVSAGESVLVGPAGALAGVVDTVQNVQQLAKILNILSFAESLSDRMASTVKGKVASAIPGDDVFSGVARGYVNGAVTNTLNKTFASMRRDIDAFLASLDLPSVVKTAGAQVAGHYLSDVDTSGVSSVAHLAGVVRSPIAFAQTIRKDATSFVSDLLKPLTRRADALVARVFSKTVGVAAGKAFAAAAIKGRVASSISSLDLGIETQNVGSTLGVSNGLLIHAFSAALTHAFVDTIITNALVSAGIAE